MRGPIGHVLGGNLPFMKILSVTSHVCFGHVGAQASVLPLQRLGHDVCLLPTVLLSNHPGYGGFGGGPVKLVRLDDLMQNMIDRGFVDQCAAAHTGYLGQPGTAPIVRQGLDRLRQAVPNAIYLCDPVLGDEGRLYVPEGVVADLRSHLLPVADIVTPNAFELALLSGRPCENLDQALEGCAYLRELGPQSVVCTTAETTAHDLAMAAITPEGRYVARVSRFDTAPHGTGDAFAAILLGRLLNGATFEQALSWAAGAVHGLIAASLDLGDAELALIEAQHEIVAPTLQVSVEKLE